MNKNGLVYFYTFMLGMSIIVLGIYSFTPIKEIMDINRDELGCAAPATDFDQALCWMLDIFKFMIPAGITLIGFAILTARRYIIG